MSASPAPATDSPHTDATNELFLFSAPTRTALLSLLAEWHTLATHPASPLRLLDAAFTASRTYSRTASTLGLTASSLEELAKKLAYARERIARPETTRIQDKSGIYFSEEKIAAQARMAFVFPGEGAQYPNMLRGLCMRYPEARAPFDEFDEACAGSEDGYRPSRVMFPPPGTADAASEEALFDMKGAVQAVTCANMALFRLFHRLGLRPDAVVGHSSGEFMALEAAGVFRHSDRAARVRFIREGYATLTRLIARTDIPAYGLLTVGGVQRDQIDAALRRFGGEVRLAMDNCPHQFVLCGPPALIERVQNELSEQGAICTRLPFDRPYHTPWFQPALIELENFMRKVGVHPPEREIFSCLNAAPFPTDTDAIIRRAVDQWAAPVRFRETIEAMYADGVRVFVDAGPRGNMTAFIDDILRESPHLTVTANRAHRSDVVQFHHALAQLAAHGAPLDVSYLYTARGARLIDPAQSPTPGRRSTALSLDPAKLDPGDFAFRLQPKLGRTAPTPRSEKPAPLPAAQDERDAVMHAYLETMENFLASQREVLDVFFADRPASTLAEPSAVAPPIFETHRVRAFPLLGPDYKVESGQRLIGRRTFDLNEDVFLRDHTLGVEVSREHPDLPALSIMPLTMSLALCAEAAQALMPELRVIAMRDIQANRWLSLEDDRVSVLLHASRIGDSTDIAVEIREEAPGDPLAGYRPPIAQAVVCMGREYPPAPPMPAINLVRERPAGWTGHEIYGDRLFHLGRFQGIRSIDRWAEEGMIGTLDVLPRDRLFASNVDPQFAVDGVLLDAMGSALGLWGNYEKWDGTVFLPFRVQRIDFFGPPLPVGSRLSLGVALRSRTASTAAADIYASTPDGKLHIRLSGWEDRIWNISPGLHRFMLRAFDMTMSEPLPLPDAIVRALPVPMVARIVRSLPHEMLEGSHRVWQKVLAFLALDAKERAEYKSFRGTARQRNLWLAGRTMAKDAARILLNERFKEQLGAADIPIAADDRGRPIALGGWRARHPESRLMVSISHREDVAVGLAVEDPRVSGVGVDIEKLRAPSADFMAGAFDDDERSALGPLSEESIWRRWCAKEAAAKALGVGLIHDARELKTVGFDPTSGRVDLRLTGGWAAAFPDRAHIGISSYTFRAKDEIVAVCVLFET